MTARSTVEVSVSVAGPGMPLIEHAEELLRQRRLPEALSAFNEAERLSAAPDLCSAGRWTTFMQLGDFESAWRESDAICRRAAPDPNRLWHGEPLAGKQVIVRALHGLGDAVQMFRYAPRLNALARSVVWEVPPRMVELARCFDGADEVITWGPGAPAASPPWQVQIEIMQLPHLFRTSLDDLPLAARYLTLPSHHLQPLPSGIDTASPLRVGLVFTTGEWNRTRELPLHLLDPLLQVAGVEFWDLHHHTQPRLPSHCTRDASTFLGDGLIPLAAAIHHLDLVITVDTLAAHLAGALGRPVWLLLQHAADWRWLADRPGSRWNTASPWYPSMRLFRQPTTGSGWHSVVARVATSLQHLVSRKAAHQSLG